MNACELAQLLDGRQYGDEITEQEEREAENSDLVVVFAYSDDGVIFRGAIHNESSCRNGGSVFIYDADLLVNKCKCNDCTYYKKTEENAYVIKATWHNEGFPCWTYETEIPHETFEIFEGYELFCRGIVFDNTYTYE